MENVDSRTSDSSSCRMKRPAVEVEVVERRDCIETITRIYRDGIPDEGTDEPSDENRIDF